MIWRVLVLIVTAALIVLGVAAQGSIRGAPPPETIPAPTSSWVLPPPAPTTSTLVINQAATATETADRGGRRP